MDKVDAYSTVQKQMGMLGLMLYFHERGQRIIRMGATISVIHALPVVNTLIRMKTEVPNENLEKLDEIHKAIDEQMTQLEADYK